MSKKNQSSSSFRPKFSLPIFPPLQLNFDAPVPVIIPPRSDPCLLNPNPYNDQVLETTSLTDIDPCVVAWRGSVANKVDLTADEHAGVSLSEPATMGSTTLETIDDVTWNSDKVLNKHMEENVLLKSTQNVTINQEPETKKKKNPDLENVTQIVLVVIEQETPSSVANDMLDQVSEKKKQDLSQKEVATKSLFACDYPKSLFVCDIPEPGRKYQKIATVEVDQSLFKKPTSVKMTPVQPSNCGTQNRPTKLSVHQPNWSDICKVSCSGDNTFDKHIVGIQHQKNLKILEKTPTPPLTTTFVTPMDTTPITKIMEESKKSAIVNNKNTWCEICKVSCPTNDYNLHASGKKHIKNLQKLEKIQTLPSTVIQSVTTPLAVPNLPSAVIQTVTTPIRETLKLTRGEVVNPNDGNSTSCQLCGVYCITRDMLNKHISGKKHQKKLKKTEQQSVSSPPPVPKTPLLEPMIEEGEIVFFEGSKRKTSDSLSSEEDADTKRLKMNEEEVACGVVVTCKVCNVGCNGLMAFKTHTASIEHSAMLLKLAKGGSNGLQI